MGVLSGVSGEALVQGVGDLRSSMTSVLWKSCKYRNSYHEWCVIYCYYNSLHGILWL